MATARIVWNGSPGEVWTNDTDRFKYQLICDLGRTCGLCLQYNLAIANWWPIPFHRNCRCTNHPIRPGRSARPFVDFRSVLDGLDPIQQTEAIGRSNYQLLSEGVVKWEDIVTETRVRSFKEVVAARKLSIETMVDAGVRPDRAQAAFAAVHTPEQVLIRQHRKELVERLETAGLSRNQLTEAIARDIHKQVSIGAGPSKASPMPASKRPDTLPGPLKAAIRRFESGFPITVLAMPKPKASVARGIDPKDLPPALVEAAKAAVRQGFSVQVLPASEFGKATAAAAYNPASDSIKINADHRVWLDPARHIRSLRGKNWLSSDDPSHLMTHEIGHGKHFRAIGRTPEQAAAMKAALPEEARAATLKEVSEYGAMNKAEFVAEVYAGRAAGRQFSPGIMQLFGELGGIEP